MSGEALRTTGLSGDHGWNEDDDAPPDGLTTALLCLATGAVWGSLWLLSGLPPFSAVASRVSKSRRA